MIVCSSVRDWMGMAMLELLATNPEILQNVTIEFPYIISLVDLNGQLFCSSTVT